MIPFINKLRKNLDKQLQEVDLKEPDSIKKSQESILCIKNTLIKLREYVSEHPFEDVQEEIRFFKKDKPEVLSKYVYHFNIFNIECRRPLGSNEIQIAYFQRHLDKLTYFFNNHIEFYHYYRMDSTLLDYQYFVRGQEDILLSQDSLLDHFDPGFSTSHDVMVAYIIAYDRLELFLKKEIEMLSFRAANPNWEYTGKAGSKNLKWTASKAALVEIIYALCASEVINDGQCDLRELSAFFEQGFNIRLPDMYRTFIEIKIRSNPSKFLDSLKISLLRKMDEDN